MQKINNNEALNKVGGAVYRCNVCKYTSSSYAKVYANALLCVTKKYGLTVLGIVSKFC